LGVLEHQERNCDEAIGLIEEAIALQPGEPDFHMNCGLAYLARGQGAEAVLHLREALRLRPAYPKAHSNLLFALNFRGEVPPAEVLEEHRRWYRANVLPGLVRLATPRNLPQPERQLRVGYVSGDFREHVIALFIEPVLAHHDQAEFEVFIYDSGAGASAGDPVTARLRGYAKRWRMIGPENDDAVAAMVREDAIDLLVDLAGHTRGARLAVFARRAAPVQLTWLGYPTTTGVDEIDYRISDPYCDPAGMTEPHYVERLLRLPDSLWCYQPGAGTPEVSKLPVLEAGVVTFGSFNQPAKVNDDVIALWARVMTAVPGSRLLMAPMPDGEARQRFRRLFAAHGVDSVRLDFEPRMPQAEYQALRGKVDIALDPFPVNGGSTTCETLWMGVPVVTLSGDRFVARAGTSLLSTLGLTGCIAETHAEYVAIAQRLAGDPARLAALRASLRDRMRRSPLMDGARFTRNLEALYRQAWRDWCRPRQAPGTC
jgi:predicted O-linked N-acetylglucosamine transferase (SPINDLY family)